MQLYIRVENGVAVNHPIVEDNFKQAFPQIDVYNLPEDFAKFERVNRPLIGVYEKNQRAVYEKGEDGVYRDVWYSDRMTEEEILQKQNEVKQAWISTGYVSWTFNEDTCSFDPPIAKPEEGMWVWDESSGSWKSESIPVQT